MLFYYIDTIEQVEAAEDFDWTVNEYGARKIYKDKTLDEVSADYYKKLSDVSNDLKSISPEKKHYYMDIKIVNSDGKIEMKQQVGKRVEPEKRKQPEPEAEG